MGGCISWARHSDHIRTAPAVLPRSVDRHVVLRQARRHPALHPALHPTQSGSVSAYSCIGVLHGDCSCEPRLTCMMGTAASCRRSAFVSARASCPSSPRRTCGRISPAPKPGGSACFYWNGYGTQCNHPAQELAPAPPQSRRGNPPRRPRSRKPSVEPGG